MPESWVFAAGLVTMIAGVLDRFVQAQRQTEAGALDRFYLHILRHPLQALREWEWSGVYLTGGRIGHVLL